MVAAYAGCSRIKTPLRPDLSFRFLGTARHINGSTVKKVKVDDVILEAVLEFCYIGDMLSV